MENEIIDELLCEMVYDEANAYCRLNNIDKNYITHEELKQCAITTAASLGFNEDDVLIQLEYYFDCEE